MRSLEEKTVDARFGTCAARRARRRTSSSSRSTTPRSAGSGEPSQVRDRPDKRASVQWPFPRRFARERDQPHRRPGTRERLPSTPVHRADDDPRATRRSDPCGADAHGAVVLSTTEVDDERPAPTSSAAIDVLERSARVPATRRSQRRRRRAPPHAYEIQGRRASASPPRSSPPVTTIPRPPATNASWIDFAGPPGTVTHYSFSDVIDGKVPPSAFKGKIVVIGPSRVVASGPPRDADVGQRR